MKLLLSLLIMNTSYAETNWDELIIVADSAKKMKAIIEKEQEFKVIQLPGGRLRFDGFDMLMNKNKIKLVVKSDEPLKDICYKYVELGPKFKFKASLVFNKTPIETDFNFILEDGSKHRSSELENKFVAGSTVMEGLGRNDKTPWTNRSNEGVDMDTSTYYEVIMNAAIKASKTSEVIVNLDENNGIACDIGLGYIRPSLIKLFEFEKAIPEPVYWLSQENHRDLYSLFNNKLNNIEKVKDAEEQKFIEAAALGWSIAQVEPTTLLDTVLKKASRGQKLIKNFKAKVGDNQDMISSWRQLAEYTKPEITMSKQHVTIGSGGVLVEFKK